MRKLYRSLFLTITFISLLISCSVEKELESDPFVIAFNELSLNLQNISNEEDIMMVYSYPPVEDGSLVISISDNIATYGVDYETNPAVIDGEITLAITKGEINNKIVFRKLNPNLSGENTFVKFKIINIDHINSNIQGYEELIINSSASLGGNLEPEVGGPNQGNQVFIDLSSQKSTAVQRDTWDLGFYCGDEFRVGINGSIFMATKATNYTDIDSVPESVLLNMQSTVTVSNGDVENLNYVDGVNGSILETAIDEISVTDSDNKVYLLNMGYEIGLYTPNIGSVDIQGPFRGWKKIRIIKNEDGYILQYANLGDTTHQEISITKDNMYNFIHFSFDTETTVEIEPKKADWDLCFTPFTNVILDPPYGSYIFSDFVIHNRKGSVVSYVVGTNDFTYEDFTYNDIIEDNFSEDQTSIGGSWRNVFNRSVYNDRFYIIKDSNNNIYKIKFLAMVNTNGVRGFPQFEYSILE